MIDKQLAQFSNLAIIAAIVVFTMAFIAFAADMAKSAAAKSDARLEGAGRAGEAGVGPHPAQGITALKFALIMAATGAMMQTLGVTLRGLATWRVPWGNMYEFTMTGVAILITVFLVMSIRLPELRSLGVFLMGPSLIVMLIAQTQWYVPAAHLTPSLQNSVWLVIHVLVAIIATGLFGLAAVTSALQLVQEPRERALAEGRPVKYPALEKIMARVPSAKRLEIISFQINSVGFVLWTFTLMFGAIWAYRAWGRYWGWDPKEVWTFIIWIVYAAYLHARFTQGFRGKRAAYFSLAGFACVIFNYTVVNTVINGLHSYSGL